MDKLVDTFVMAVCRETGKVLDAREYEYSWDLENLLERHDASKVDFVIRKGLRTMPEPVPVEEYIPPVPPQTPGAAELHPDEDIPF